VAVLSGGQNSTGLAKMTTAGQRTSIPGSSKSRVTDLLSEPNIINFGELPEAINALLQRGVAAYRHDRSRADRLFRQALAAAPTELPIYFCLYKIHTYQGNLDEAQAAAESGLREAASQAGWNADWREWRPQPVLPDGAGRFALYTLKALAFIHLRQGNTDQANQILDRLKQLDPTGAVGWPVVAALADGVD
jgi:tetratricopeptide (TPR) repeat protein